MKMPNSREQEEMQSTDGGELSAEALAGYVARLRAGDVLVCATETQFGLLADALNEDAVRRVCAIKGRSADAPLALLLPSTSTLGAVAEGLSNTGLALAHAHWPGPLTLLVRAKAALPSAVTRAGKVGVRVPGASPALSLCRAFGGPLTATSANRSGQPVVITGEQARTLFGDEVGGVVPGRPGGAVPSTIVDVTGSVPQLVRAGALPWSALGLLAASQER